MKDKRILPMIGLVGGAIAGILRCGQRRTGFDPMTGLAIEGNSYGMLLLLLGVGCLALCLVAGQKLSKDIVGFAQAFPASTVALCCMVAGSFLVMVSGAWMAKEAFGVSQMDLIIGLAIVFGGVGLLGVVPACGKEPGKKVDATFAVMSVVAAVVVVIVCYRTVSINPVLWEYGVEMLALCTILLALFHLVGFGFDMGNLKSFCPSATMAIVLCGAMMSDELSLEMTLYFAGNGVLLFGFLMAHCWCAPKGKHVIEEL